MTINRLISLVNGYTYATPQWLMKIYKIATHINRAGIDGDFVECGCYKGGCSAILGNALTDRHLWLYDSFQGLPQPELVDGIKSHGYKGKCLADIEDVKRILSLSNISEHQYTIKSGWFDDTYKEIKPNEIALLYCDADWYHSTMLSLETFYPLVSDGGCIILDDFGTWEGCREAFYDYCFKYNIKPLVERYSHTQLFWFKNIIHNRNGNNWGI